MRLLGVMNIRPETQPRQLDARLPSVEARIRPPRAAMRPQTAAAPPHTQPFVVASRLTLRKEGARPTPTPVAPVIAGLRAINGLSSQERLLQQTVRPLLVTWRLPWLSTADPRPHRLDRNVEDLGP